ncbi:hypothetical protein [Roseococcus pinisoli]|uniref:Bacteriophage tail tape measure N-terminal domain-containing protein n=1 Tax=Roseococcus pinisoli TaxID=2835040 RepID=A0ABS5QF97_9PROT|nr:hypothetical protein [Roseococcus pinisoli]MBS7812346.1 hypothetical protein [Roseococcus pinisoli]
MTEDQVLQFVLKMRDEASAVLAGYTKELAASGAKHAAVAAAAGLMGTALKAVKADVAGLTTVIIAATTAKKAFSEASGFVSDHASTVASSVTNAARAFMVLSPVTRAAVVGLTATAMAANAGTREWNAYSAAMGRFNASAAGVSFSELNRQAERISQTTNSSAADVVSAGQRLARFSRGDSAAFNRATGLAPQLASFRGTDTVTAANELGGLMSDPMRGLARVRRDLGNTNQTDAYRMRQMEESFDFEGQRQLLLSRVQQSVQGSNALDPNNISANYAKATEAVGQFYEAHTRGLGRFIVEGLQLNQATGTVTTPIAGMIRLFTDLVRSATDTSRSLWAHVAGAEDPVERIDNQIAAQRRQRAALQANASRSALQRAGASLDANPDELTPEQRAIYDREVRRLSSRQSAGIDRRISGLDAARLTARPLAGLTQTQQDRADGVSRMWEGLDSYREQQTTLTNRLRGAQLSISEQESINPAFITSQPAERQEQMATQLSRAREAAAILATQLRELKTTWEQNVQAFADQSGLAGLTQGAQALETTLRAVAVAYAGIASNQVTATEARELDTVRIEAVRQFLQLIVQQGRAESTLSASTREARTAITEAIMQGAAAEEEANRQLTIRQALVSKFGAENMSRPEFQAAIATERNRLETTTQTDQDESRARASNRYVQALNEQIAAEARLAIGVRGGASAHQEAIRFAAAHTEALKAGREGTEAYRNELDKLLTLLRTRDSVMGQRMVSELLAQADAFRQVAAAARDGAAAFQMAQDVRNAPPGSGAAGAVAVGEARDADGLVAAQRAEFEARIRRAGDQAAAANGGNSYEQSAARTRAEQAVRETVAREIAIIRAEFLRLAAAGIDPNAPRGERNNNPLNIRDGSYARGREGYLGGDRPNGGMARFATREQGLAAADSLLAGPGYRNLGTPLAVINRWAPRSDGNNPESYAETVRRETGLGPNDQINLRDAATRGRLLRGMMVAEGSPRNSNSALDAARIAGNTALADNEAQRSSAIASQNANIDRQVDLIRKSYEYLSSSRITVEELGLFQQAYRAAQETSNRTAGDFTAILDQQLARLRGQRDVQNQLNTLEAAAQMRRQTAAINAQTDMSGMSNLQREAATRRYDLTESLRRQNIPLGSAAGQAAIEADDERTAALRRNALSQSSLSRYVGNDGKEAWERYSDAAVSGLDAMNSGLAEALTGTRTLAEGMSSAARTMANALSRELMKELVTGPLANFLKSLMGGATSGGGAGGFFSSLFGAASSLTGMGGGAKSAFADGGIMTSMGPVQLRKYANGGVANNPQLALFGEGAQPEAYVPLPDGRSIPVTMAAPISAPPSSTNVMSSNVEVHLHMDAPAGGGSTGGSGGMSPDQAARMTNDVARIVQATVATELQRQMRPRGMLSSSGM